jgi:hypothetical protein
MRKLITFLLVLSLLLAVMPSLAVFAAESGSSSGSFTVGGDVPQVNAFQTYSDADCLTTANEFTPQLTYYAKVTVTDANTLNDIQVVTVKIYYDEDTATPLDESTIVAGAAQTAAILTWTKATGLWTIDAGTPTTWAIVSGSCVTPTMGDTTGDWIFAFKVGKVATESVGDAGWEMHARVTDGTFYTHGMYRLGKHVLWYGQITVSTANINFGIVNTNTGFADNVNEVTGITLTTISNGDFWGQAKSSATWAGVTYSADFDQTGACSNPNEFSLKVWCDDTFGSAVQITLAGANITTMTQTTETGMERTEITLWLRIAAVFPIDTYSVPFISW